jgi:hypothetical protein
MSTNLMYVKAIATRFLTDQCAKGQSINERLMAMESKNVHQGGGFWAMQNLPDTLRVCEYNKF